MSSAHSLGYGWCGCLSVEGLMVMVGRLVRSALSVGLLAGVLVVLPVVGPVPEAGAAPAVVGGSCSSPGPHGFGAVSYTHLTLPTSDLV